MDKRKAKRPFIIVLYCSYYYFFSARFATRLLFDFFFRGESRWDSLREIRFRNYFQGKMKETPWLELTLWKFRENSVCKNTNNIFSVNVVFPYVRILPLEFKRSAQPIFSGLRQEAIRPAAGHSYIFYLEAIEISLRYISKVFFRKDFYFYPWAVVSINT